MSNIFSPSWWASTIAATLVTMLFIVLIKRVASAANIPVVNSIVSEV